MDSYALYTKYRPQTFDDVIGQDKLVLALKTSVEKDKPSHAYIFYGTRGIGKTTLARILANSLGVSQKDVYEIDAASHTGVDDMRELKDNAYSLPFESKYKIYILDEAHMLSKSAFNALLKILEEPPRHVIFILATTELEKIPDTVKSRCETHILKTPSKADLRAVLEKVAENEGFDIEKTALDILARFAYGSFRDALVNLQRVIAIAESKLITTELVENVLNIPHDELVEKLISAVHEKDCDTAIKVLQNANENGVDFMIFSHFLIDKLRNIILLRSASSVEDRLKEELSEDDVKFIKNIAVSADSGINVNFLKLVIEEAQKIKTATIKSLPLEIAIIEALK